MDDLQIMFGRLAEIIHKTMGGKATRQQIWPVFADKKKETLKKVWGDKGDYEKMRSAIKKAHGIDI